MMLQVRRLAAALAACGVLMGAGIATAGAANASTSATASSHVVPAGTWYIWNYYSSDASCQLWGEAVVRAGLGRSFFCDGSNSGSNPWALWVLSF
jgi:hypothetical protein